MAEISSQNKIYLQPGEKPPKGKQVYRGERGGSFYIAEEKTDDFEIAPFEVDASESLKHTIEDFKQNIVSVFKELPEWHYKNASFIIREADELSAIKDGERVYRAGLYNSISRTVYISEIVGELTEKDVFELYDGKIEISPSKAWKLITLHEMAHRIMDFQTVFPKYVEMIKEENDSEFTKTPKYGCTKYAFKNYKERFAEAYVFYVENPNHLKDSDKNMYDFMKEKVFAGKEYSESLVKSIDYESLPDGSYWIEDKEYNKMLLNRKKKREMTGKIDNLLEKAYASSGSYIPVTTLIHRKDGSVSTAIRWKRFDQLGTTKLSQKRDLPAVRTVQQTPGFTRGSTIIQTLFLLVDEIDIEDILQSNFVTTINYEYLGEGLYLYSSIDIAQERAEEYGKKILPAKVNVTRVFSSTLENIRNQEIESLSLQGYEAIVLMRDEPYTFDVFCFDNRDVIVIGDDAAGESGTEEVQKSIEDYEVDNSEQIVSKEWLESKKVIPCKGTKDILAKSGRPKPAPLKEDGTVDYEAVGVGDSIWVTVTQEDSPLKGRPVIITKRPDNMFALTGGSGFSQIKDKHGLKTRTDALRHMLMTGRPKKTKADEELDKIQEEAEANNIPYIEEKQKLMTEARKQLDGFQSTLDQALNITPMNRQQIKKHREEFVEKAKDMGYDEELASSFATCVIRSLTPVNRKLEERQRIQAGLKIQKYKDMIAKGEITSEQAIQGINKDLDFKPITVDINPKQFEGLTEREMESKIDDIIDEKYGEILNPNSDDKDISEELAAIGVELDEKEKDPNIMQVEIGNTITPIDIKDEKALLETGKKFNEYYGTKKKINEVSSRIKKVDTAKTTPAMLEQMAQSVKQVLGEDHSDAELEDVLRSYDEQYKYNNSAHSFYKAVDSFWNDEQSLRKQLDRTDNGFGGYINGGASSALAALSGANYGERVDVSKLIENTSIEAAASIMAMDLRERFKNDPAQYDAMIARVEESNANLLIKTEQRALKRHEKLKKRYQTIQEGKETGLLQPRDDGMAEGEIFNLVEQKKNLGTALGSMQASAAFLNALLTVRSAKDDSITINFGEDLKGAELRARELKIEGRRGFIDTSDPKNVSLKTSASALKRHMRSIEVTKDIHDEFEKIKTDMSGTSIDEEGNTIADDYEIANWNDEYKVRVEQRNDIEFLKKFKNGMITRVTGAGKTNTALGFFSEMLKEDSNYSAVAVVPKGRGGQWEEEAGKFFDMDIVHVPERITKEERTKIIAGIKPGQIAIISQEDAIVSFFDLEASFASGSMKGLVLDEPQEVASKSIKGNMSAATRKFMKLQAQNRLVLTATPARDNLVEVYDYANWVSHRDKRLGPRTRFKNTYEGYGSGTNAQDAVLRQMIFKEIAPYISGDRLTNPTFKVSKNEVLVNKTKIQDENMRRIEMGAKDLIASAVEKAKQEIRNDPAKLKRMQEKHGTHWQSIVTGQTTTKARKKILDMHDDNLSGIDKTNMKWADNPKISIAVEKIAAATDKKHVIFLDNPKQRAALKEGLLASGYSLKQIKNIASTLGEVTGPQMAANVKAFRTDDNVRIIFIDKKSASGYNLQEGDDLHVLGTPSDAANYLQAQGRLARMPREGDVGIYTYKYDDVPFEDQKWTTLENQLAILKATVPGMFVGDDDE